MINFFYVTEILKPSTLLISWTPSICILYFLYSFFSLTFLRADDTSSAFECILEKGEIGEIYNIGCDDGMEYSVMDIAKILIKKIKKTDNYETT